MGATGQAGGLAGGVPNLPKSDVFEKQIGAREEGDQKQKEEEVEKPEAKLGARSVAKAEDSPPDSPIQAPLAKSRASVETLRQTAEAMEAKGPRVSQSFYTSTAAKNSIGLNLQRKIDTLQKEVTELEKHPQSAKLAFETKTELLKLQRVQTEAKPLISSQHTILKTMNCEPRLDKKVAAITKELEAVKSIDPKTLSADAKKIYGETLKLLMGALNECEKGLGSQRITSSKNSLQKLLSLTDSITAKKTEVEAMLKSLIKTIAPEAHKNIARLPTEHQATGAKAQVRLSAGTPPPLPSSIAKESLDLHPNVARQVRTVEQVVTGLLYVKSAMRGTLETVAKDVTSAKPTLAEQIDNYVDTIARLETRLETAETELSQLSNSRTKNQALGFVAEWKATIADMRNTLEGLRAFNEVGYNKLVTCETSVFQRLESAAKNPKQAGSEVNQALTTIKEFKAELEKNQKDLDPRIQSVYENKLSQLEKAILDAAPKLLSLTKSEERLLDSIVNGSRPLSSMTSKDDIEVLTSLLSKRLTLGVHGFPGQDHKLDTLLFLLESPAVSPKVSEQLHEKLSGLLSEYKKVSGFESKKPKLEDALSNIDKGFAALSKMKTDSNLAGVYYLEAMRGLKTAQARTDALGPQFKKLTASLSLALRAAASDSKAMKLTADKKEMFDKLKSNPHYVESLTDSKDPERLRRIISKNAASFAVSADYNPQARLEAASDLLTAMGRCLSSTSLSEKIFTDPTAADSETISTFSETALGEIDHSIQYLLDEITGPDAAKATDALKTLKEFGESVTLALRSTDPKNIPPHLESLKTLIDINITSRLATVLGETGTAQGQNRALKALVVFEQIGFEDIRQRILFSPAAAGKPSEFTSVGKQFEQLLLNDPTTSTAFKEAKDLLKQIQNSKDLDEIDTLQKQLDGKFITIGKNRPEIKESINALKRNYGLEVQNHQNNVKNAIKSEISTKLKDELQAVNGKESELKQLLTDFKSAKPEEKDALAQKLDATLGEFKNALKELHKDKNAKALMTQDSFIPTNEILEAIKGSDWCKGIIQERKNVLQLGIADLKTESNVDAMLAKAGVIKKQVEEGLPNAVISRDITRSVDEEVKIGILANQNKGKPTVPPELRAAASDYLLKQMVELSGPNFRKPESDDTNVAIKTATQLLIRSDDPFEKRVLSAYDAMDIRPKDKAPIELQKERGRVLCNGYMSLVNMRDKFEKLQTSLNTSLKGLDEPNRKNAQVIIEKLKAAQDETETLIQAFEQSIGEKGKELLARIKGRNREDQKAEDALIREFGEVVNDAEGISILTKTVAKEGLCDKIISFATELPKLASIESQATDAAFMGTESTKRSSFERTQRGINFSEQAQGINTSFQGSLPLQLGSLLQNTPTSMQETRQSLLSANTDSRNKMLELNKSFTTKK